MKNTQLFTAAKRNDFCVKATTIYRNLLVCGMLLLCLNANAKWDVPGSEGIGTKQKKDALNNIVPLKPDAKQQGKQGMDKGAPLSFIENKGQVRDQFKFPRHDMQYSLKAGKGLNIFIGNGAIHYQFSKAEEDATINGLNYLSPRFGAKTQNLASLHRNEKQSKKMSLYRMDVELVGANKNAAIVTSEQQAYTESYVMAGSSREGNMAHSFNRITYKNVYPNIDWVLYTSAGELKHEFLVHKGGRVSDIKLKYGGATGLKLDDKGALIAETPQGTITEQAPYTYEQGGKKVSSSFKLSNDVLSYETGVFNGDLVIDPTLAWATYYGGSENEGSIWEEDYDNHVAVDGDGNVYLTGTTRSTSGIVTSGAYQETIAEWEGETYEDGFLVKFNSSGVRQWATYYGGAGGESVTGIATDGDGNIYVVGLTGSETGISTSGSFQEAFGYSFLIKFNTSGSRVWGTYFGAPPAVASIRHIAIDNSNNIYINGDVWFSGSGGSIATSGADDETYAGGHDIFLAKFTTSGSRTWCTYYGGSAGETADGLSVGDDGSIYIVGYTESSSGIATSGAHDEDYNDGYNDAFLAKYNTAGVKQWATYTEGDGSGMTIYSALGGGSGYSVAADHSGNVYISASRSTSWFNITTSGGYLEPHIWQNGNYGDGLNGAGWFAKYNGAGAKQWGSFLNQRTYEDTWGIFSNALAVDADNNLLMAGRTRASLDVASPGAYQSAYSGGERDGFLMQFNPSGLPIYGTYYGGTGDEEFNDIAVSTDGNIYLAGYTNSTTGIATSGSHQTTIGGGIDAFLVKFTNGACSFADPGTISGGPTDMCVGTIYLGYGYYTSSVPGGEWLSSKFDYCGFDDVYLPSGTFFTVPNMALTTTVRYRVGNSCGWAYANQIDVTVHIGGSEIELTDGDNTICTAGTTTLTASVAGGVWISGNTSVATIGSSSGIVSGISAGTAALTYYVTESCGTNAFYMDLVVQDYADAGTITGTATTCTGNTTTLSNVATAGVWSSSNNSIATVGTGGVVTGVSAGTATISYTKHNTCGFVSATRDVTITIGADPGTITGTTTVCVGNTTALSNAVSGGTWSSSNTGIATVGTSGIVTGIATGNATITYTVSGGGCGTAFAIKEVTINGTPSAGTITGSATVCTGATTTLSNATSGGVWSSGATGIATVGTSGVVTGVSAGNATISYTVTNGCGTAVATKGVTVNTTPGAGTITGTATVCTGATTALSNATSGGVWSSGATGVATVGTSGIVSGVSAGNATISYSVTNGCGTTVATQDVTVNATPSAGTITGTATVCVSATTALSNATGGGVWSSGATGIATVGTSGIVTGVSAGNATISYSVTNGCGTAVATRGVTVNAAPSAGSITGASSVNVGATTTLSNATSGGVWSSSATGIATVGTGGVVTGVAAGNVTISYTVTNSCGSATATKAMTVNGTTLGPILGTLTVCVGSTTSLSNATSGGTWTSSNTAVATIGMSTGIVTGMSAGTSTITYTVAGNYVTTVVSVNPLPATISGAANVCLSATTTLANATAGGAWSSNNAAIASVDAGGVVSGVAVGNTTITYTLGTGCYRTKAMAVSPLPSAITGTSSVCVGNTTSLSNSTTGGTAWTSSAPSVATVGSSNGVVTGVAAGNTTITYTVSTGCYATREVTVNALPAAITGTTFICAGGAATTLSTASTGGTWTSSNTAMATVGSASGLVTSVPAVNGGSVNITYTLATSCRRVAAVSVGTMPAAITGSMSMCIGGTTTLASATAGCTWSSSNPAAATIGTSGIVSGISSGTSTISYTHASTCGRSAVVSVSAAPAAIAGTFTVCAGATVTLTDATAGGTWASSSPAKATINSTTGLVTGMAAGTTLITYTVGSGCKVFATLTVNAAVANITGTLNVCVGSTTALSSTASGGAWSSSNAALGTVSGAGVVTGISAGTPTISYTLNGCFKTANVTVKALPAAIAGSAAVCVGSTSTLTCPSPVGVSWTSSAPSIASIGITSGVMTGVAAGNATITYLNNTGCRSTRQVTVNAAPNAGVISGPITVIIGNNITLSSTVTGGTWTSANAGIASVGAGTGLVTGVSAGGPVDITYTANNGCGSAFSTYGVEVTTSRPGGQVPGAGAGASVVFKVFPNPTAGSITIEAPVVGVFSVHTIDGRQVATYNITDPTTLLSLPNTLASGIYMCRFNGEDGSNVMVRLVYER